MSNLETTRECPHDRVAQKIFTTTPIDPLSTSSSRDAASCILDKYRSRLAVLLKGILSVDSSSEMLAEKVIDTEVVYLLASGSYRFGIIASNYSIASFNSRMFENISLLCEKQTDEEGKMTGGEPDCTKESALKKFQSL